MSRYQSIVPALAERMRRKELSRLVYFHTDHFEPWTDINGEAASSQATVDRVGDFVDACSKLEFARRLTLFYKPNLNYDLSTDDELIRADPDDLIGFRNYDEEEKAFGKAAMGYLIANGNHEIQVHIHHEYYTTNHGHIDPSYIKYFSKPGAGDLDVRRLELAIRLNREIITRETGAPLDRWFFVHGQWALNASDDESCRITREIEILKAHGCLGDFTFPAGRPQVDPKLQYPYFARPVNARKGYDLPEAEPELAYGNARAAREKFFIWASPAKALHCSLDYFSEQTRRRLDNVEQAAIDLVELSYQTDRRLFIKTHAHSVHTNYFENGKTAVFPHEYPSAKAVLSVIFDAARLAGIEVDFLGASEVYDLFVNADVPLRADPVPPTAVANGKENGAHPTLATSGATVRGDFAIPVVASAAAGSPLEFVREIASQTLRRRIAKKGTLESGAYRHYSTLLDSGLLLPRYEQAIFALIRQHVPPMTDCHEIGSGIGTLLFLLAMSGYTAVGIERDKRRHAAAEAILRDIRKQAPSIESRCKLLHGSFPQMIEGMDVSRSVAIVSDFISTQKPEQLDLIVAGLRRYRYVIMDMQRFSERRPEREQQQELLQELTRRGFGACVDTVDLDADGYYCLFENNPAPFEPDWIHRDYPNALMASRKSGPGFVRNVARLFQANR